MTRVASIDPENLNERQRKAYEAIAASRPGGVRGPLAVWLARPEFADLAQSLGRYCRFETLLPPRLSELAILVTARVWSSEFEWQAHKKFALKAGLATSTIEAVRQGRVPDFSSDDESIVHDFALAVHRDRKVSQNLYNKAVSILGEAAVIDLTGLLGYYALVAMTINVFDVDPLDPTARELD